MPKDLYMTVEGPKGAAEVFEVTDDAAATGVAARAWEPKYQVEFGGQVTVYNSEGEALTVAQQLTGAPDNY